MTSAELEKLVDEILFKNKETKLNPISLMTGKGGIKNMIKAECEVWGIPHTWRAVRAIYTRYKREGKIYRGVDEQGYRYWYVIF